MSAVDCSIVWPTTNKMINLPHHNHYHHHHWSSLYFTLVVGSLSLVFKSSQLASLGIDSVQTTWPWSVSLICAPWSLWAIVCCNLLAVSFLFIYGEIGVGVCERGREKRTTNNDDDDNISHHSLDTYICMVRSNLYYRRRKHPPSKTIEGRCVTASFGGVLLLYVALFLLRHPLLRQHYLHNHLRLLLVTRYTSPYAIRHNAFLRPLPEGRNQCVTLIRPRWPCRRWYKCLSSTYYYRRWCRVYVVVVCVLFGL